VGISSFMKQLKKHIRRKRRLLILGIWLLMLGGALVASNIWQSVSQEEAAAADNDWTYAISDSAQTTGKVHFDGTIPSDEFVAQLRNDRGQREVILETIYVCGEESKNIGIKTSEEALQMYREHPQWEGRIHQEKIIFSDRIEDLSPKCKENAYFGLDKNGNLTLFEGLPKEENAIRTFFQLNIKHLESSLPREAVQSLYDGIRVADYADYNSVLSTFSDFAVEETEKVMKPAQ
jgi:forespore regulator of the sigma-K checkpoint